MSRLPTIKGTQLIRIFRKFDFVVIRIKGSHHFLRHPDGRCTVVPVHRAEAIGKGLLAQILKDCELTRDDIFPDKK